MAAYAFVQLFSFLLSLLIGAETVALPQLYRPPGQMVGSQVVAVDITPDNRYLAIGAVHDGNKRGTIYIYDEGVLVKTIEDQYGCARLAISHDGAVLFVGTQGALEATVDSRLRAYSGASWNTVTDIKDWPGAAQLGKISTNDDGSRVIVGELIGQTAHVFSGASWVTEWVLTPSDGGALFTFGAGTAMSADGTIVAVSSPGWDGVANGAGKVYVFTGDLSAGGTEQGIVPDAEDPTAGTNENFGFSISMNHAGDRLAIGVLTSADGGTNRGRVIIKHGVAFADETVITGLEVGNTKYFGRTVAMSPDGLTVIASNYFGGGVEKITLNGAGAVTAQVLLETDPVEILRIGGRDDDVNGGSQGLALSNDVQVGGLGGNEDTYLHGVTFLWGSPGYSAPAAPPPIVELDTSSESPDGGSTAEDTIEWQHEGDTGATAPNLAVVFVLTMADEDDIDGVPTYGGEPMIALPGGQAIDTAGEPGRVDTFYLQNPPAGEQTVVVPRVNNATVMKGVAFTTTGSVGAQIIGASIVLQQTDGILEPLEVDDGSPGGYSLRAAALNSGLPDVPAPGNDTYAVLQSDDFGARVMSSLYEVVPTTGASFIGWDDPSSDDRAAVYFAIQALSYDPLNPPAGGNLLLMGIG